MITEAKNKLIKGKKNAKRKHSKKNIHRKNRS